MSVPDEVMKLKDGKIIVDKLKSMVAVQFVQATANDAGTYVVYQGQVYYLPDGHTANTTWENTTKVGPTNIGDELSGVKTAIHGLEDTTDDLNNAVFTTGTQYQNAPNLFDDVTDTNMMLSIGTSSFGSAENLYGFYVDISEYNGKEILIKRTNSGKRLRGVFTADVPAVNVVYDSSNKWDELTAFIGDVRVLTVPQNVNYLYVAYYSSDQDTITKEQALAGMTIVQMNDDNLFDDASDDMLLSFSSGKFSTASSLYGFYIPVDEEIGDHIYVERTSEGSRFRFAFSTLIPAEGVSYDGYSTTFDSRNFIHTSIPTGSKYMYIAYYRTSDSLTKEQLLAGIKIRYEIGEIIETDSGKASKIEELHKDIYTKGNVNLYEQRSDIMTLALGATAFSDGTTLHGFYVPISPVLGTTVTVRRKNDGARFRIVSCANKPANGTSYGSDKVVTKDSATEIIYDKILSTDRYLYVAYYSTTNDTLPEQKLLDGMTIFYGTEYMADESRIDRLYYPNGVSFANGNINSIGVVEESSKHIVSEEIRVYERYGISCPSAYTVTVHEYDFIGKHLLSYDVTNATRYTKHSGIVRVCISKNDNTDITPTTVDFSEIKIPHNRFSAKAYADEMSSVLDAENCTCKDVYAYIDEIADSHSSYVSKTLLCTESSGLPVYYYTLGNGAKKICIVSGQHGPGSNGDPRDSVITVAKIMHDLINGDFEQGSFLQTLHDDYTMLIIPILNPYGFDNFSRYNADNADTNRDWVDGNTTEVSSAKPVISAFSPFMALDVHCNGTKPNGNGTLEAPQFGFGDTHNPLFEAAASDYFSSYYNVTIADRSPNTDDTLQVYIRETLNALGGLLELRWWMKDRKWMHDYQAESCDYAMVINSIKYFASVNDSETYSYEHTPNQNQY